MVDSNTSKELNGVLERASVLRFQKALDAFGILGKIHVLADTAKTAADAAAGLGIEVGQIASSLIFTVPHQSPLLVITSGRHRVRTDLVAAHLGIEKLGKADADYVKAVTGFSVGGVAPFGWKADEGHEEIGQMDPPIILIDKALDDYEIIWAAAGHPHAVFPTTYLELLTHTGATALVVGD